MTMLTITTTRDGEARTIVWSDGDLAGDEAVLEIVESLERTEAEVRITPTGPTLVVDRAEPRTVIRGLEEWGTVEVAGDMPDPTWEDQDEGNDVDW